VPRRRTGGDPLSASGFSDHPLRQLIRPLWISPANQQWLLACERLLGSRRVGSRGSVVVSALLQAGARQWLGPLQFFCTHGRPPVAGSAGRQTAERWSRLRNYLLRSGSRPKFSADRGLLRGHWRTSRNSMIQPRERKARNQTRHSALRNGVCSRSLS